MTSSPPSGRTTPTWRHRSHVNRTKSSAAGHANGYPVWVELLWVGEYRVSVLAIWTDWARLGSTLTELGTGPYNVVEVGSDLSG